MEQAERTRILEEWQAHFGAKYQTYEEMYRGLMERARMRIGLADPRIGCQDGTFLLCHNWGNEESRQVMARYQGVTSKLLQRRDRELAATDHELHVALGEVGEYLWCSKCQQRSG